MELTSSACNQLADITRRHPLEDDDGSKEYSSSVRRDWEPHVPRPPSARMDAHRSRVPICDIVSTPVRRLNSIEPQAKDCKRNMSFVFVSRCGTGELGHHSQSTECKFRRNFRLLLAPAEFLPVLWKHILTFELRIKKDGRQDLEDCTCGTCA